MKRFYETASVRNTGGGHAVLLDARAIKTPQGRDLVVPWAGLAEAIAAEWQAQGETVEPAGMRLTRIACTALDRIAGARDEALDRIAALGATDLVCYRASGPAELVAREQAAWEPLLDWLAERYGARLSVVCGLAPTTQPAAALDLLRAALDGLDDIRISALSGAGAATGSLVIALALCEGRLDAGAAFDASQVEESHQIDRWGDDPHSAARRAELRAEIEALAACFRLCGE